MPRKTSRLPPPSRPVLADSRWSRAGWALVDPVARWWDRHPLLRVVAGFCLLVGVVAGLILFGIFLHYDRAAAKFDVHRVAVMPEQSTVYDARGEVIGHLHGDGRKMVSLDDVSPFFQKALVAREDKRFYRHGGVDLIGAIRAGLRNTKDGEVVQGASTLTMQLARNTFDQREKTIRRKMIEMALARRVESHYSKDDILSLYVNRIFFGSGLNGIEQAAQGYFGKSARNLSLPESAMIAGIIRAPNRFSPYRHYEDAIREMQDTLDRMAEEKFIPRAEADTAKSMRPAVLPAEHGLQVRRGSRVQNAREDSEVLEAVFQKVDSILTDDQRDEGGVEIYTTIDLTLQEFAGQAVEKQLLQIEMQPGFQHPTYASFAAKYPERNPAVQPNYLQAAVSVIDNSNGAIRVMIGGRDFRHSRFNRATQARRQVGSILKPLVYATAFETGLFPGTLVSDDPIRVDEIQWDRTGWDPKNPDGKSLGLQPVSVGLIRSRNPMSVRVGERAGFEAVKTMLDHAGIAAEANLDETPQVYIGNLGASLHSLVSAYSVFANEGWRHEPFLIERIESRDGEVIFDRTKATGYRVLSPGATWLTSNLMQQTLQPGGTGAAVRELGFTAAAGGKTGTTNDFRDAWFLGYTSKLTGGIWIGMDQPETIIDGGYGGKLALPIWTAVMLAAETSGYQFDALPQSDEILEVELCRISGCLAGDECRRLNCVYREQVPHAMIPRTGCDQHSRESDLTNREEPGFFGRIKNILEP
ncbi:MAG: hypothetical protein HKN23_00465 [Verrucomicrobiales bacterium]|nr:hypothetical protein [Verrucomicrobiales bacterium]